jgi:hypothetical protein
VSSQLDVEAHSSPRGWLGAAASWLLLRLVVDSPSHLAALGKEDDLVELARPGLDPAWNGDRGKAALFTLCCVSARDPVARLAMAKSEPLMRQIALTRRRSQEHSRLALSCLFNLSIAENNLFAKLDGLLDDLLDLAASAGDLRELA